VSFPLSASIEPDFSRIQPRWNRTMRNCKAFVLLAVASLLVLDKLTSGTRIEHCVSGLHRDGLDVPVIGRIARERSDGPKCATFRVRSGCNCSGAARFGRSDGPFLCRSHQDRQLPLAMDLEAWLDTVEATGPPSGAGFVTCCARTSLSTSPANFSSTLRPRQNTGRPYPWIDVHAAHVETSPRRAFG
jgi:hypothetical protein